LESFRLGGRTIRRQRLALEQQLTTTTNISNQNAALHKRVVTASSQATEQTERTLRRIGFDLHDGPAQYLSLAALRLDAALGRNPTTDEDVTQVRGSLSKALDELRIISRGLALPDLDEIDFFALVNRAIGDHQKQTGMQIDLKIDATSTSLHWIMPKSSACSDFCKRRFQMRRATPTLKRRTS
jgi:signal transduction histidine kinase